MPNASIANSHLIFFKPSARTDERWTAQLREAIKENRLALLYQPIISLHGEPGERYQIYTAVRDEAVSLDKTPKESSVSLESVSLLVQHERSAFATSAPKCLGDLTTTSGGDYISIKPTVGAAIIDQYSADLSDVLRVVLAHVE